MAHGDGGEGFPDFEGGEEGGAVDALADGAVVLDVEGFVMLKQSGRWFLPGEEYEYHRSAADLPVTVLVEADDPHIRFFERIQGL